MTPEQLIACHNDSTLTARFPGTVLFKTNLKHTQRVLINACKGARLSCSCDLDAWRFVGEVKLLVFTAA
jgi:hypothetical protein